MKWLYIVILTALCLSDSHSAPTPKLPPRMRSFGELPVYDLFRYEKHIYMKQGTEMWDPRGPGCWFNARCIDDLETWWFPSEVMVEPID